MNPKKESVRAEPVEARGARRSVPDVPGMRDRPLRVLGLFPHPDDEAYAAGGLLAHCAAAGAEVRIVCATRGEAGTDRRGVAAPGGALAALRTRELEASCRALEIGSPELLDLPDGGLAAIDADAAAAELTRRIAAVDPALVVTLGPDGVYGSLDHMAWTAVVSATVEPLSPPPRLLHAVFPRRLFTPLCRALARRRGPRLVAASDPDRLGVDARTADLRFDLRPQRARKLAAITAHASQLRDGDPYSLFLPGIVSRLLDEEWYVVAHGPALPADATDPLAGL
jgi:LmbE family N-acetylglucosaminyl deacetylase